MKICFWNTQRNPALSQPNIAWPIADLKIACEVLGEDTLKVSKQNRRRHMAQLGYRVVTPTINVYLEEVEIDNFKTLTGYTFWLSGGNFFKLQSKRQVAHVYAIPPARLDENIFVYHCNSSTRAASLMPWVIAHLATNFDSFILLGDFNCEPDLLRKNLSYLFHTCSNNSLKADLKGVRIVWAGHTHNAKYRATKTLDYIVTKGCDYALKEDTSTQAADHYPIVATESARRFTGTRSHSLSWTYRGFKWSVKWKRVYNNNGCVAWELVG